MRGKLRVCAASQAVLLMFSAALATGTLPAAPAAATREPDPPYRLDVIQEDSVRLILLDVKMQDRDGRPLRGLTADDFTLRLDGRPWPVYSVDEICGDGGTVQASGSAPMSGSGTASAALSGAATQSEPLIPPSAPGRFVLYFDFSNLMQDGRRRARGAALAWLREVHRPGEVVEVVAFSTLAGLKVLEPWTESSDRIRGAIERAFRDRALVDPYVSLWLSRLESCADCLKYRCQAPAVGMEVDCSGSCMECEASAREDFLHGQRSLSVMKSYLALLGETPGSKSVILFTQGALLSPGSPYPLKDPDFTIGTHLMLLEQVAAEATEARAAFYPVTGGDYPRGEGEDDLRGVPGPPRNSTAQAALLAEFTGGDYSRSRFDADRLLRRAGREDACTYRLAFRPPADGGGRSRALRAEVRAQGRVLPWIYRVHHLSEADRNTRRARALLAGVARDTSLDVVASLQPVEAGARRWKAAVQVAMELSTLGLVTVGRGAESRLEVGALLEDEDRGKIWELAGSATLRGKVGAGSGAVLLYENVIEDLRPGRYRLRAFVHDRSLDRSGLGDAALVLPHPGRDGFIGPLASLPGRRVYSASLPLVGGPDTVAPGVIRIRPDDSPLGSRMVRRGEPLRMTSWICAAPEHAGDQLIRYVEKSGVPIYRMPMGWADRAGRCTRVTDLFHTIELQPGLYTYRVGWREEGGNGPRHESRPVAFQVVEGPGGPALVARASR